MNELSWLNNFILIFLFLISMNLSLSYFEFSATCSLAAKSNYIFFSLLI